ncbi:biotin-(acetyl-CoA carboxylase) ligase [Breoghania corrubedonensis]|uniref:biotin--[biotin carboxyl-carrier protein] ligase n=1 Tax=Breoghania corrubedonensis TaxID=665038 RepID=A0A2T5VAR8_9HYPH|nr:biotin/lipoate--protein ligase family protein [Breoghania corrubedonensis]PTW60847.1 biotin-(acetyl-CoA carboxylase) ligase [Breoghania corrubedonensis]
MTSSTPDLPPLMSGHKVASSQVPFAEACRGAQAGRFGAGDLVWSDDPARLDVALVLEPEVAPSRAREMLLVAMVAAGDAIGALVPPEVALTWDWPASLFANDGGIGGAGLRLCESLDADGAPDWMVIGLTVALRPAPRAGEPGLDPDRTTLYDEGCGEIATSDLIAAFARHLMTWIDTWQQDGLARVGEAWLFRMRTRDQGEVTVAHEGAALRGRVRGLDEHGRLLLECADDTIALEIHDADPA